MQLAEQVAETHVSIGHRGGRALQIAVGLTLLAIAALYILILIEFTTDMMVLHPGIYTTPCRLFIRTRNVAFLVVLMYLGLNLLATRKRPVLFLRRFGLDINSVVSRVIQKGLGRQFRFVTLDDGRFPPLHIPAFERWATRLGPPAIAVVVVLGALAARKTLSAHPASNGATQVTAAQMSLVMGYWIAILWTLLMLGWIHLLRIHRKARYKIQTDAQLNGFLFDTQHLGRWRVRLSWLRPQAVVAKVSDSLWRRCVLAVAAQCGIALIDVSDPTPNLQWEIEQSRAMALQCVFIAERSHLQSWVRAGENAPGAGARERIRELIGDDCVLLYRSDHKLGGAWFRRSLQQLVRKASNQLPRRSRAMHFPLIDRLWRMSLAAIFHAFVLFLALASGALLGVFVASWTQTN
jgi:hypothetical protein